MMETVGEIRVYLDKWQDNPKAYGTGLKLKLDALEKMAKMMGAYPSDSPTVNVQVNNVFTKEALEKSLKESEEYFKAIDAEDTDAGN